MNVLLNCIHQLIPFIVAELPLVLIGFKPRDRSQCCFVSVLERQSLALVSIIINTLQNQLHIKANYTCIVSIPLNIPVIFVTKPNILQFINSPVGS